MGRESQGAGHRLKGGTGDPGQAGGPGRWTREKQGGNQDWNQGGRVVKARPEDHPSPEVCSLCNPLHKAWFLQLVTLPHLSLSFSQNLLPQAASPHFQRTGKYGKRGRERRKGRETEKERINVAGRETSGELQGRYRAGEREIRTETQHKPGPEKAQDRTSQLWGQK
jgi:hypothetical protein